MRKKPKLFRLYLIGAIVVILAIVFIVLETSGMFKSEPKVEVRADNCYQEVLHVVTDEDYRPYSFFTEDGECSGHDVELAIMIANELNMNLDLQFMTWEEGIAAVKSGKADVLMTCDTGDDYSVERVVLTETTSYDMFAAFGKERLFNIDELYDKSLGVMKSGNVINTLKELGLVHNCTFYDSNREAMEAMMAGEVDYAIMRNNLGTLMLKELKLKGVKARISLGESIMCFGVNYREPELAGKINQALRGFRVDGTMAKLNEKWLTTFVQPYSIRTVLERQPLILMLILLVVLALVVLMVNAQRQRVVESRQGAVIRGLTDDFACVNYVEGENGSAPDKTTAFRTSETLRRVIPGWEEEKSFTKKLEMLRELIPLPEDREDFARRTERGVVLERVGSGEAYYVNFMLLVEGEEQYYQLKFTGDRNADGTIRGIVAGLHNVDDEMRQELKMKEELLISKNQAEAASAAKTNFLFNMSHDIRTPMNAIIGFTNLAIKNIDDKERVLDALEKTGKSSNLLLSLINDILDMSRIESGKVVLKTEPADLNQAVQSIAPALYELAEQKRVELAFDCSGLTRPHVLVDLNRLERIMINIINNAIKYTPSGGVVKARLSVHPEERKGWCIFRFVCEDNGIGMSEEFQKHVWDEFSREETSTSSGIQGTGLGLSLCKALTNLMNGQINCVSKQGVGSTFTVEIPLEYMEEDESGNVIMMGDHSWQEMDLSGRRVLLVEDNELNREIATELLEEEGMIVDQAENGAISVQMVRENGADFYDYVLMDIQMPIMNGYEATRAIRAFFPDIRIPIIALSANAFAEDRQKSLEAGMDAHIAKPINMKELIQVLASHVR